MWEGKDRRMTTNDHDVLTRIDANLSNHMRRFDNHATEFSAHILKDAADFKEMNLKMDNINRFIWMSLGAAVVIQFLGIGFLLLFLKLIIKRFV